MNKQSKSLGKRSTNIASLSNAISSIKSNITPVLVTGRCASHPKPLKANNEMWLPRTVRIYLSQPVTTSDTELSLASVFNNAQVTGQIRVLQLKAWNYTNQTSSTNYIQLNTSGGLTETAVTTSVNDVGGSQSLPGVMVKIPRTIASNLVTSSTIDSLCTIKTTPVGAVPVAQSVVVDVHFEYKTDTTA